MIALTATVTKSIREDVICILEMDGCRQVSVSPNRSNIYYEVRTRNNESLETDMAPLVESLKKKRNRAERVIVYCHTVNLCVTLYEHFHMALGEDSYFPPGAPNISVNRYLECFMHKHFPTSRSIS